MTAEDEKALVRKIDWMIMPLMWCCYVAQYLDKTLINYAAVMGLYEDANITKADFSNLVSCFCRTLGDEASLLTRAGLDFLRLVPSIRISPWLWHAALPYSQISRSHGIALGHHRYSHRSLPLLRWSHHHQSSARLLRSRSCTFAHAHHHNVVQEERTTSSHWHLVPRHRYRHNHWLIAVIRIPTCPQRFPLLLANSLFGGGTAYYLYWHYGRACVP